MVCLQKHRIEYFALQDDVQFIARGPTANTAHIHEKRRNEPPQSTLRNEQNPARPAGQVGIAYLNHARVPSGCSNGMQTVMMTADDPEIHCLQEQKAPNNEDEGSSPVAHALLPEAPKHDSHA